MRDRFRKARSPCRIRSWKSSPAAPAPAQVLPVDKVSNVVEEASFERALHHQGFFEGWKGSATFGLAITESTVNSQTVTSALRFLRVDPSESWMRVRNRTIVDFNSAYGNITQPGTPSVKISLYHAGIEQDRYLSPRWFLLASAGFDHNVSQGLDLLQAYGGGIGAIVFKGEHSELDARGDVDYMHQSYSDPKLSRKLVGSKFGETYTRTFARGFTLNEQASVRPAWNDTQELVCEFSSRTEHAGVSPPGGVAVYL